MEMVRRYVDNWKSELMGNNELLKCPFVPANTLLLNIPKVSGEISAIDPWRIATAFKVNQQPRLAHIPRDRTELPFCILELLKWYFCIIY